MGQVLPDALRVEVGYNATPLTALASITWTDITSSVRLDDGVTFSRGRSETDTIARPGTLSLTLDNSNQKGGIGRWSTKTAPWSTTAATWADTVTGWDGYSITGSTTAETAAIGGLAPLVLRMPIRVYARYPFSTNNLVSNPSFETDTTGWAALASSTIATSTTRSVTGTQSALVTWATGAAQSQIALINCTTTIGQAYTVSFWAYVPSGSPDVAASCNLISTGTSMTTKDQWVRISHTFTATGTTSSVGVRNMTAATAGQVCYIDGVQCEAGSTMTPYSSGSPASVPLWLGYIEGINYGWANGRRPIVQVSASDRLARLQKRSLPSLVLGEQLVDAPVAVWPLDDAILTTTAGNRSTTSGISALSVTQLGTGGTLTFGSDTTAAGPGYAPGPDDIYCANFAPTGSTPYVNGKYLVAASGVSAGQASNTAQTVEAYFKAATGTTYLGIVSADGRPSVGGDLQIYLTTTNTIYAAVHLGPVTGSITGATTAAPGSWHHVAFKQTLNSGLSRVDIELFLDGVSQGTSYYAAPTINGSLGIPVFDTLSVGATRDSTASSTQYATNLFNGLISSVAYYNTALSSTRIAAHAAARYTMSSYTGEAASTKFTSVCRIAGLGSGEYAVQTGASGATSATMTPIPISGRPLLDAVTDVATAEGSCAYLSRSGVLTLASGDYRYSVLPSFILPAQTIDKNTDFTADMSFMVNDVTVTRPSGSTQRALNSTSIAAYDTHDQKIDSVYVSTDSRALDLATWYANINATPTPRANDISVDLVTAGQLIDQGQVLACEVGSRFLVTGLPNSSSPTPILDLFVEGVTDNVTETSWTRKFVASPSDPYQVMTLDDDVLGLLDDTAYLAL